MSEEISAVQIIAESLKEQVSVPEITDNPIKYFIQVLYYQRKTKVRAEVSS